MKKTSQRPIYLDCNATTPLDPQVQKEIIPFLEVEFGNAGSRTHEYGVRAKQAVQRARDQIASVVNAQRDEVIFTSGATESNNLVLLGLAKYAEETGKKHIVSTQIEHKAVLEPLKYLSQLGFEVTLVPPNAKGWVEPEAINNALRSDTILVSVMHVNNETGVIQPLSEIAETLVDHPAFFHTDGAQGFGKVIEPLRNSRIDLISISGHKIYGPKGIGALITRRREFKRPPLKALMYGGGQEKGLRPGTLPVHLIVGLGKAAELSLKEADSRAALCSKFKIEMLEALKQLNPEIHGDPERTLPNVINLSFHNLDAEAVMVTLKDLVAISNGSACTSTNYEPSHVLKAMGKSKKIIQTATRWSWCYMTKEPYWDQVVSILKQLF